MATQSINFANITVVNFNGAAKDLVNRNGVRLWQRVWVTSSVQQSVNNGYWTYPAPYQAFIETSRTPTSQFWWNPWYTEDGQAQWIGTMGPNSAWITTGDYSATGFDRYWQGQNYSVSGYYEWQYPSAYWTDSWVTQTVDTSHYVYYY